MRAHHPSRCEAGAPADTARRFLRIAACAAALTFPPAAAQAAELSKTALPPTTTYSDETLRLAGCGTREISVLFVGVELYVISLYLPSPPADVAAILAPGTTKLVQLNVTYDGTVPNDLPEEWRTRINDAISAEMLRTLQGFYKRIRSGDVVTIGYATDSGTTLRINGDTVVSRPGDELIRAMLAIWIGDNPISDNLKRLLLHGSCP